MNTIYPNNLSKNKYTEVVLLTYTVKYEKYFTYEQIKEPIELLIDRVDHIINHFNKLEYKKHALDDLKNVCAGNYIHSLIAPEALKVAHYFFSRNEQKIKNYIENVCDIEFPNKFKDEYFDFITEMSKELLTQICDHVERFILKNNSDKNEKKRSAQETKKKSNKKIKFASGTQEELYLDTVSLTQG